MSGKRLLNRQELEEKYRALADLNAMEQTKAFLKGFVLEFQGRIEELMDTATVWGNFHGVSEGVTPGKQTGPPAGLLGEFEAHLFLEKREETLTVSGLRENLKEINLPDKLRKVAFIEYLLWKYHKSLQDLFAPPEVPPEALEALEKAINEYERVLVCEDQLEQNKREINSAAAKRKAQRVVDDVEAREKEREIQRQAALKSEEERVAAEKKKREEEEARAKEESRQRLKAKASLWN